MVVNDFHKWEQIFIFLAMKKTKTFNGLSDTVCTQFQLKDCLSGIEIPIIKIIYAHDVTIWFCTPDHMRQVQGFWDWFIPH